MRKFIVIVTLAICIMLSSLPVYAASSEALDAADALYELGLFNGTGTDENGNPIYDLDRQPTRHEAITMLVRLLGKESEALSGTWDIPFTDVAEWAKPYVGYAYTNGLTNGTSDTTFGGDTTISATQYLTFILRVLGYKDGTDFKWDAAWLLTDQLGITSGEYADTSKLFLRGDVATISYQALSATPKGSQQTLSSVLGLNDNKSVVPTKINADYYLYNGGYYDNGLGHLYEIEYQGNTEYYIQAGELWDFLTIITNSLKASPSNNPFLAGRFKADVDSEYTENGKPVWVTGDITYVHWDEYTSISERETWVEYRYNGASVAFTADSNYDDYHVSEQSGITCISMYSLNFVSIPQTLQTLGIDGKLVISEIDGIGCVWSFE